MVNFVNQKLFGTNVHIVLIYHSYSLTKYAKLFLTTLLLWCQVDFKLRLDGTELSANLRTNMDDWISNLGTILRWSPFSSEHELLKQVITTYSKTRIYGLLGDWNIGKCFSSTECFNSMCSTHFLNNYFLKPSFLSLSSICFCMYRSGLFLSL